MTAGRLVRAIGRVAELRFGTDFVNSLGRSVLRALLFIEQVTKALGD
jgi:hypothetical protein